MAQVVRTNLPSMCKALGSIPNTSKKKKNQNQKQTLSYH
jgi:hypothetical protein